MQRRGLFYASLAVVFLGLGLSYHLADAQSSSTNYKVEETYFGSGGELDATSANYRAKQSAGELGAGNSASNNYQMQAGFNTSNTPVLEVAVNGGTYDLGLLDSANVHSTSATFTVRNYLSSGYVVRLTGDPPTSNSGGHSLTPMSALDFSIPGTEQFGVNMVDNATPNVGANPEQDPDVSFSFGAAASGYSTADKFKFVDGDIIASSPKSSGQTLYTLSVIANINSNTPVGVYGGNLSVVVTATF